jgi:hypothetical protein
MRIFADNFNLFADEKNLNNCWIDGGGAVLGAV